MLSRRREHPPSNSLPGTSISTSAQRRGSILNIEGRIRDLEQRQE
jgi:hypothetical protein